MRLVNPWGLARFTLTSFALYIQFWWHHFVQKHESSLLKVTRVQRRMRKKPRPLLRRLRGEGHSRVSPTGLDCPKQGTGPLACGHEDSVVASHPAQTGAHLYQHCLVLHPPPTVCSSTHSQPCCHPHILHECQALQKTLLGSYFFLTSILPRAGGHPFYR
jgi:hypothetical protein